MGRFFPRKFIFAAVMGLGNFAISASRYPDLQVPDTWPAWAGTGSCRLRGYLEGAIRKGGNLTGRVYQNEANSLPPINDIMIKIERKCRHEVKGHKSSR